MSITRGSVIFKVGSANFLRLLSFFFLLCALVSCGVVGKKNKLGGPVEYEMTVAAIRPARETDAYHEVTFEESARFYRIPKNTSPAYLELLRDSEKNRTRVWVKRANEYADEILRVRKK